MKALTWQGAHDVRVETMPDPIMQDGEDILLRVTATAICGSDLHLYRHKVPGMKEGDILGHEFMGIVEEVGPAVTRVQRGDRVVVPFNISCGDCFFCDRLLYAACENSNPDRGAILNKKDIPPAAGMFGYTHLYGGYPGGQAEYVRVPFGNTVPLKLPALTDGGLPDERVLFLSDILPTGYQAVLNAGVGQGSSLAIFGAGPVGCMTAACARLLGVETIFMVDREPYRLEFARRTYGAETINFDEHDDPAQIINEMSGGRGVDGTVDAIGFEAKGSAIETALTTLKIEGSSGKALRQAIACTRRGGTVSVPGVYAGFIHAFMFGDAFDKGLTFKMGQTHVLRYMPELLEHIVEGRLQPEVLISHRMPLAEAAAGYEMFEHKRDDCRKVVLTP